MMSGPIVPNYEEERIITTFHRFFFISLFTGSRNGVDVDMHWNNWSSLVDEGTCYTSVM